MLDALALGGERRVNTYTTNEQVYAAIAMDAAGDYVVVWESRFQGGGISNNIYAQRYSASGAPQGSEFAVNANTMQGQFLPIVAMDADGDFVVVWSGGAGSGLTGKRFSAAGVPQGSVFPVNTSPGSLVDAEIAMDDVGNFVVVWEQENGLDGNLSGIFAQRFNAAGVPQGTEFRVNTYTTSNQRTPSVAMDADGDFVVAWESFKGGFTSFEVCAQRFNSAGVPQGGEFTANTYTLSEQKNPSVAMDPDGNFVIAWDSLGQDNNSAAVIARQYDSSGTAQGGEILVNSYTTGVQWEPSAAMDSDGNFVVIWSGDQEDGSGMGVFGQAFSSAGFRQGGEFRANTFTSSEQTRCAVAMDADGSFSVVWDSVDQDGSQFGVYSQRYATVSGGLGFQFFQTIALAFSEALDPATVSATDLLALNLDNSATPVASGVSLSSGDTVATWRFNTSGTSISDGDYRFTLPAGSVADANGTPVTSLYQLSGADIFFLAADANRDRIVNLADFNILASNFGQSNRTFSQGDFNYDSIVNLADFNILASRFGSSINPSGSAMFGLSPIRSPRDATSENDPALPLPM